MRTLSSCVWALTVPAVKRHWLQSPGAGVAAFDVTTMGCAAVPKACNAPHLSVKLAPASIRTSTPGSMTRVALLSRITSPCST